MVVWGGGGGRGNEHPTFFLLDLETKRGSIIAISCSKEQFNVLLSWQGEALNLYWDSQQYFIDCTNVIAFTQNAKVSTLNLVFTQDDRTVSVDFALVTINSFMVTKHE